MSFIDHYFEDLWEFSSRENHGVPRVQLTENAFPAFLEADISGDDVEVPMCLAPYFISKANMGYDRIVFSLVSGSDENGRRTFHHKTVNTILRKFLDATNHSMRLAHIVTSKGVHYYGCKGLILDADYNPLLVSTGRFKITDDNRLSITHPICRVSYRVFNSPGELLEKTIIKQAIPLYSRINVNCSLGTPYNVEGVEVIVGDWDYMVVRPAKPTLEKASPEGVNGMILQCYDSL